MVVHATGCVYEGVRFSRLGVSATVMQLRFCTRRLSTGAGDRLITLAKSLTASKQTVALAETSSGGMMATELLALRGASAFFKGGVVAYSKGAKEVLLGLDPAKSKPTAGEAHALELARAARDHLGSDWAIGETGVAGPTANSHGVAPGVCALAVVGPDGAKRSTTLWPDDGLGAADAYGQAPKVGRRDAMQAFAAAGLELLCEAIAAEEAKRAP